MPDNISVESFPKRAAVVKLPTSTIRGRAASIVVVCLVALVVIFPLVVRSPFYQHVIISIALSVILGTTLLFIFNTGQLSMAHAAFLAIGAYSSAILVTRFGINFWLALPLAGVTAGIVAAIVGAPILRLRGVYFILMTFAFGEAIRLFFAHAFTGIFGGATGIWDIPAPKFLTVDFMTSRIAFYYLAVAIMLITVLVLYRLNRSRVGLIFRSIREADIVSQHAGINIMLYKVLAFSIACFFVGLAGSFYAHYNFVLVPEDFPFERSLNVVIYMVVGGTGSLAGPVVGASILTVVFESLATFPYHRAIIFGVILIIVIMFLREGLVGLPRSASQLTTGVVRRLRRSSDSRASQS